MKYYIRYILGVLILGILLSLVSCKKIRSLRDENPDLIVLRQGFKASAAIGYCASLAHMAFTGNQLPSNVRFNPDYSSRSESKENSWDFYGISIFKVRI